MSGSFRDRAPISETTDNPYHALPDETPSSRRASSRLSRNAVTRSSQANGSELHTSHEVAVEIKDTGSINQSSSAQAQAESQHATTQGRRATPKVQPDAKSPSRAPSRMSKVRSFVARSISSLGVRAETPREEGTQLSEMETPPEREEKKLGETPKATETKEQSQPITMDTIKEKLKNGKKLNDIERMVLRKEFGDQTDLLITFIGEYHKDYSPKVFYLLQYYPNILALIAEIFYALFQAKTSTEGLQSFSDHVESLPSDMIKYLGPILGLIDLISNVCLFDGKGEAYKFHSDSIEEPWFYEKILAAITKVFNPETYENFSEGAADPATYKKLVSHILDVFHYANNKFHNAVGGYADIVPLEGWLKEQNIFAAWAIRFIFLFLADRYYSGYLQRKYDEGLEHLKTDEWLILKFIRRWEFAIPFVVTYEVLSATLLRALSFYYLNAWFRAAVGGYWLSDNAAFFVVASHTIISREHATAGKFYDDLETIKSMLKDFSPENIKEQNETVFRLTLGKGIDVTNQEEMNNAYKIVHSAVKKQLNPLNKPVVPSSYRIRNWLRGGAESYHTHQLIDERGVALNEHKSYWKLATEESLSTAMSIINAVTVSYVAEAVAMLVYNNDTREVEFTDYGLTFFISAFLFLKAEHNRKSYTNVRKDLDEAALRELRKIGIGGTPAPETSLTLRQRCAAAVCSPTFLISLFGYFINIGSQFGRGISNLTFAEDAAEKNGIDPTLAIRIALLMSFGNFINATLLNWDLIGNTLARHARGCSTKPKTDEAKHGSYGTQQDEKAQPLLGKQFLSDDSEVPVLVGKGNIASSDDAGRNDTIIDIQTEGTKRNRRNSESFFKEAGGFTPTPTTPPLTPRSPVGLMSDLRATDDVLKTRSNILGSSLT